MAEVFLRQRLKKQRSRSHRWAAFRSLVGGLLILSGLTSASGIAQTETSPPEPSSEPASVSTIPSTPPPSQGEETVRKARIQKELDQIDSLRAQMQENDLAGKVLKATYDLMSEGDYTFPESLSALAEYCAEFPDIHDRPWEYRDVCEFFKDTSITDVIRTWRLDQILDEVSESIRNGLPASKALNQGLFGQTSLDMELDAEREVRLKKVRLAELPLAPKKLLSRWMEKWKEGKRGPVQTFVHRVFVRDWHTPLYVGSFIFGGVVGSVIVMASQEPTTSAVLEHRWFVLGNASLTLLLRMFWTPISEMIAGKTDPELGETDLRHRTGAKTYVRHTILSSFVFSTIAALAVATGTDPKYDLQDFSTTLGSLVTLTKMAIGLTPALVLNVAINTPLTALLNYRTLKRKDRHLLKMQKKGLHIGEVLDQLRPLYIREDLRGRIEQAIVGMFVTADLMVLKYAWSAGNMEWAVPAIVVAAAAWAKPFYHLYLQGRFKRKSPLVNCTDALSDLDSPD